MNDTEDGGQAGQPQGDRQAPPHGRELPAKPVGSEDGDHAQNQNRQRAGGPMERFLKSTSFWKSHGFWLAIGTWVLVAVTGVIGKCALDDTERVLTASQRAWVGPSASYIADWPATGGKGIKGTTVYSNYGKEPALDVVIVTTAKTYSRDAWANGTATKGIEQAAKACYQVAARPGALGIFPSSTFATTNLTWDTSTFEAPVLSSEALINGDLHFALITCVAYRTFDRVRHTTFCHKYQAKTELKLDALAYCTVGNTAD